MKCKICHKRFRLLKENKYVVTVHPTGLTCLTIPIKTYEAFDCPKCGCQNIVNQRLEFNIHMIEHAYCFLPYQVFKAVEDIIEICGHDGTGAVMLGYRYYRLKDGKRIHIYAG